MIPLVDSPSRRTGREAINTEPDCLDDPGAFVAKHERKRSRYALVANVDIGLAEASRDHPDQHLVIAWLAKFEQLVNQRVTGPVRDSRSNARHKIPIITKLAFSFI